MIDPPDLTDFQLVLGLAREKGAEIGTVDAAEIIYRSGFRTHRFVGSPFG